MLELIVNRLAQSSQITGGFNSNGRVRKQRVLVRNLRLNLVSDIAFVCVITITLY
jgi:hypothetical protein